SPLRSWPKVTLHSLFDERRSQGERNMLGGLSLLGVTGHALQHLVRGAEEDADTKDDERADHGPPGERDFGNRAGLLKRPVDAEQGGRRVQEGDVQLASDNSREEPGRD